MPDARALFRLNADAKWGWGHLRRCLALAEKLREEGHSLVFWGRFEPAVESELKSKNITLVRDITEASEKGPYSVAVVDHYGRDAFFHGAIREFSKRILVIDDLANRNYDADLLVDPNVGGGEARYAGKVPPSCRVLSGPRYSLQPSRFSELRETLAPHDGRIKKVFVSFGASRDGLTEAARAMRVLTLPKFRDWEVEVAVASETPELSELRGLCEKRGATLLIGEKDLSSRMAACDLAICSASTMLWELCALGRPSLTWTMVENQRPVANYAENEKVTKYLGHRGGFAVEEIAFALGEMKDRPELVRDLAARAKACVDGAGVDRVVKALKEIG